MGAVYTGRTMKTTPRLHLDAAFESQREIALEREQAHYLTNVLRLAPGDAVAIFNARDGEWLAYLADVSRKGASLRCERQGSAAPPPPW